jgi:aspartyl-tRNA(Asn)/glutamyl-tRNA(Gln) amidotransferase subunit A
MYGVIPAVWSQDTAGPLTRTVADCALVMNVIAGYDPHDPLSARLPVPDYTAVPGRGRVPAGCGYCFETSLSPPE